jgi:hypothetical protein
MALYEAARRSESSLPSLHVRLSPAVKLRQLLEQVFGFCMSALAALSHMPSEMSQGSCVGQAEAAEWAASEDILQMPDQFQVDAGSI